ncbi:hypothetical protein JCM6882_001138 [Rhodosporidiobolus microsporus]
MTSPSASPPSPPSRAVPLPPSPPPPQPSATPAPPLSIDDQIDLSTLSYLSSTLSLRPLGLYPHWLFRLTVFTSISFLTRRLSPYLFTFLRWTVSRLWSLVELLVRVAAFLALWAGLIGTVVWLAAGAGMLVVYVALRARPRWRAFARERPAAARGVKKLGGYGGAWVLVRRVFGAWGGKAVVVGVLGWEAWGLVGGGAQGKKASTAPIPSAPSPSSAPPADSSPPPSQHPPAGEDLPPPAADDVEANDEELERWARQVKEEMLRDSLLRAGRKGPSSGRGEARSEDVEGESAAGEGEGEEGE